MFSMVSYNIIQIKILILISYHGSNHDPQPDPKPGLDPNPDISAQDPFNFDADPDLDPGSELEKMDPDPNLGKDIYFKFTDFLTEEDFQNYFSSLLFLLLEPLKDKNVWSDPDPDPTPNPTPNPDPNPNSNSKVYFDP